MSRCASCFEPFVQRSRQSPPPFGEPAFCWDTFKDEPIRADENTIIEFFTDVEGNWEYFLMLIQESKVMFWRCDEERGLWGPGILELRDNCVLVFGGDALDKGPGDIRFVKTLLSLKHRYPDRVAIVLGPRDVNKLRFWSELDPLHDPSRFYCWWLEKGGVTYDEYLQANEMTRGLVTTCQWMLDCSMECHGATFGHRKRELSMIAGRKKVTDMDVVNSYRECVNPKGADAWTLDLLRVGKLAVVIRDTLFLHGDINDMNISYIPEHCILDQARSDARAHYYQTVGWNSCSEWVDGLNRWKDEELDAFMQHPEFFKHGEQGRGGLALIDYCRPGGCCLRTLLCASPYSNGNPRLVSAKVEQKLRKWKIARVLSGHQPHGQSPTVMRHPETGLLRITCDTSYSHMSAPKIFNTSNNRGNVVSSVRLLGNEITIEGRLLDGTKHHAVLHTDPDKDKLPYALVGRQLADDSWVKFVVEVDMEKWMVGVCRQVDCIIETRMCGVIACRFLLKDSFKTPKLAFSGEDYNHASGLSMDFGVTQEESPHVQSEMMSFDRGGHKARTVPLSWVTVPLNFPTKNSLSSGSWSLNDSWTLTNSDNEHESVFCLEELDHFNTYLIAPQGILTKPHYPPGALSHGPLQEATVRKINQLIARGKRVVFLSNNSNYSRLELADAQMKLGITFLPDQHPEKHVLSTAYTCALWLYQTGKKKPFLVTSHTGLLKELRGVGIKDYVATINDDGTPKEKYLQIVQSKDTVMNLIYEEPDVDAVVAGWDQQLSTLKIAVAAMYIRRNPSIGLITCSSDNSYALGPLSEGCHMVHGVGNGVVSSSICRCLGEDPESFAIDVGKSKRSVIMLEQMANSEEDGGYGIDFRSSVVIGDTLETDIALANIRGMKSVLVFSGVTTRQTFERLSLMRETRKHHSYLPTWTFDTILDA